MDGSLLILNRYPGDAFTLAGTYSVSGRYVFDKDQDDDSFSVFVGLGAGLFTGTFVARSQLGFTPVDDILLSANLSFSPGLQELIPSVKMEARPFDRFLWASHTNVGLAFTIELGYIKHIKLPSSPTGYAGVGISVYFKGK